MRVYLLTIGDEILIGQTVNTNAAWLGEQFSLLGADVTGAAVVRDDPAAITSGLERGFAEADLVVTTGGLGPTHDDLTKKVVADFFGLPLKQNDEIVRRIEGYYAQTDRPVPEAVRTLAEVPVGFELLDNPVGTAPGLFYEEQRGEEQEGNLKRSLIVLPGVPQEMKRIMEAAALPRLKERGVGLRMVAHRTLQTTGIVESSLQERLGEVADLLGEGLSLAYLPSTSGVRLRLTARAESKAAAEEKLQEAEDRLRARIDTYIFGTGTDELEAVVGRMLAEQGLTVALAESATGGFTAHRFTNVSGSSRYFLGSLVAYDNRVKTALLDVDATTIETQGAVSEAVARKMALAARQRFGADLGLSTTGVAGPTGGTEQNPVGTVCIGCATEDGARAARLRFTQDRQLNKELFSTALLEMLRRELLNAEQSPPTPFVHQQN